MSQKVSFGSTALAAVVLLALVVIGRQMFYATPSGPSFPAELSSIVLPTPKPLKPFTLVDQEGQPFTLEHLQGQWTFLFFGYTHCPDICPMAMGLLGEVFQQLKEKSPQDLAKSAAALVTVDPARDTPMILKQYVAFFNPEFKGLSGTEEQIKGFTRQVGAAYFLPSDFKGGNGEKATPPHGRECQPDQPYQCLFSD
ncbi:MAG: SCO family protein [Magnetococcus sp. YQC-3]